LGSAAVQQAPKLLDQELAARQLCELLLFFYHRSILVLNAAQRVEVLRVYRLSQDAGIEKAGAVDVRDFAAQAIHQPQQAVEIRIRIHIVDPERVELSADAVDASGSLNHSRGVPMQIVIDQVTAVLEVLTLG